MTPARRRVLVAIGRLLKAHGYPPSQREVCSALGFRSSNAAWEAIEWLRQHGFVAREDRSALQWNQGPSRALALTAAGLLEVGELPSLPSGTVEEPRRCAECGFETFQPSDRPCFACRHVLEQAS